MFVSSNVSVIIPTYNRSHLLVEAIESVVHQTEPVGEIVVVDDGSTDDTPALLKRLEAQISNLKTVTIEHTRLLGPIRNAGVAASEGAIVAFLDSDDVWCPERVEHQLNQWRALPEAAIAFCNVTRFNDQGVLPQGPYLASSADYSGNIVGDLLREPIVVPSALMLTREAFDQTGPFTRRTINEDYELVLEIAAHYTASYSPESLVFMREHGGDRARERFDLANLEYIDMIHTFLKRHPEITLEQKAQARQGLANVHFKLARLYMEDGNRTKAAKQIAAMARVRPWDRRLPGVVAMLAGFQSDARPPSSGKRS